MFEVADLEILDDEECRALLASVSVGRVVFTYRALPAVQPVSFVLHGDAIVIRTAPGSKLSGATRDTVVAFEADDIDAEDRSGWSVTVVGHASAVDGVLRIPLDVVTGRRVESKNPLRPAVGE